MFIVSELFEQVDQLKKSRDFVTNNFLPLSALTRISKEEDSHLLYGGDAILLIENDNGVNRMHFYLASLDVAFELVSLLQRMPIKPVVTDCIGKSHQVEKLSKALSAAGFRMYTKLSRWRSKSISFFAHDYFADEFFRIAKASDCKAILHILYKYFDPYVSHLPNAEKLLRLIENQLVFCAVNDGEIIAVVCLDRIGEKTIYSYQVVVVEEYRTAGIGVILMQYALYHFRTCTRYIAWTEDSNVTSNRIHKALGMSYDGLKDHVLIYE